MNGIIYWEPPLLCPAWLPHSICHENWPKQFMGEAELQGCEWQKLSSGRETQWGKVWSDVLGGSIELTCGGRNGLSVTDMTELWVRWKWPSHTEDTIISHELSSCLGDVHGEYQGIQSSLGTWKCLPLRIFAKASDHRGNLSLAHSC